ncbi:TRAP transporter large permease subunit [Rhizobium mesosinicum]|uniref:TRAP transporter large permease subunit n=1 Tax=Rhizobium mesosinicum TaxID=335017 RepID=A0ABS7GPI6_9HYPH|nr:TRAP transporter large permease subunit [Rhizobium mesosinicum]MBW9051144.1 TRAP transporter large permease subunit [Rhizobium mesosinicum]
MSLKCEVQKSSQTFGSVGSSRLIPSIERVLVAVTEPAAAALVVSEIGILFTGVVSRYVFHSPLVWADEIASILFLWLSMLGAVIASQRSQHMRMTAIVGKLGPQTRAMAETLAVAVSVLFLAVLFPSALHYAENEIIITTPALEISNFWRALALPVGIGLMLLHGVLGLSRMLLPRSNFIGVVLVALIGLFLFAASPLLVAIGNLNLLVFFVGLVAAMVFAGVPIAFAFGLSTFAYLSLTTTVPLEVLIGTMDEGMSHLILLSVPMFVFLGLLIEMTGMARSMVDFLASLLGHVRGGLSYVLVGAMYLVSGISGAKAADMAAVAPVLFPEMKKRGSDPGDLVALLAATGAQTETVPPSIVLITIGSVTGVSIAALFTGGMLPGLLLAVGLCSVIWYRYRNEDLSHVIRCTKRVILKRLVIAIPALALPFVIRAAVIEGVATATEVSTIGIVYSATVGLLVYRQFDWHRLRPMLVETAALSGSILIIIGAATGMAWSLTQSGFSYDLANTLGSLPGGSTTFLLVSIVTFIVLGSVLEGIPAIVLFGPLLFPIARKMGIDEVHYSMVVILSMGLGLFAPPFGVGYYAACAIGKVNPDSGMRPILGYLAALVVGLLIVAFVPWFSIGFL